MKTGELRDRVEFQARAPLPDSDTGTAVGDWLPQFIAAAKLIPLRRGEAVLAGRLQGVQPYILTIAGSARTDAIRTDWRCVNMRTGETFNLRTVERNLKDGIVEMVIDVGPADG